MALASGARHDRLILTGMAIHYPDRFGIFGSMANAVRWHSWIGFALIFNAFLGIFYHVTAEKYHHFLPRMDDFTGAAIRQARFYFYGIFKGEKHPFDADPRRKLNPLQKITYLLLLNVLLPFQIVTGVLMWGADRWPGLFSWIGGLWVLGPAHTSRELSISDIFDWPHLSINDRPYSEKSSSRDDHGLSC